MILCDREIKTLAQELQMISPFESKSQHKGVISYGLSSFGYDARLAAVTTAYRPDMIIDPKVPDQRSVYTRDPREESYWDGYIVIPPNGFFLGSTVERFKMPENVLALCVGKSTYARAGISVLCTPLEPGWEGYVTLEIANHTSAPVKIYVNEGICQFLFFRGMTPEASYMIKAAGKYQNQPDRPVLPIV